MSLVWTHLGNSLVSLAAAIMSSGYKQPTLDRLRMGSNPGVLKMIKKKGLDDEIVIYSTKVNKVNKRGKSQVRALLVTSKAIYNLSSQDFTVCKRRIELEKLAGFIISTVCDEMVIHVPEEYDYKLLTELKDEIAGVVKEIVKRYLHRDLSISHVKHDNLEIRGEKPEKSDKRGFLSQAAPSTPSKGSSHGTSYLAAGDEEEENTTELISTKEKVNLSSFEILKVLGRGAFGKVVQVRKKDTDSLYAMKILKKKFIYENQQVEHTMAERSILAAFENPFIMNLRYAFQTKDKLYLVMDLYKGGELYHHLEKLKRFSEPAARIIIAEIAIAIGHLHSLHFIYRDLKPENVLMDNSGHVCLTDFGLAKRVEPDEPFSNTFVGTPQYIAPEILRSQPHGKAVDWWSLGIMLYELVVGIPPFYSPNLNEMFERIQSAPLRFPRDLSSEIMDLISRLLVRDPSTRLGSGESDIEEIISHPFFRSIDWEKLFSKEITPPYQPQVRESWIDGGPRPDLDLDLNSFVEGGNTLKNAGDTDKFLDFTFVSENTLRKKK